MPTVTPMRRPGQAPLALVWLLLVALLLQGGAAALAQALGRMHTHQPVAVRAHEPGWIDSLLAWRAARLAGLQTAAVFRHAPQPADLHPETDSHSHDGLERHHHDVSDASVQALDGAPDADMGTSAAAAQPWGPTVQPRLPMPRLVAGPWPRAPAARWSSALLSLPERPPRA